MAADDAAPMPQSDVIPTLSVAGDQLVAEILRCMADPSAGTVELHHACAGRPEAGRAWQPIVIVEVGERRWLMSAATARDVADQVALNRTLEWAFGDRGEFAALFLIAADEAEALASGRTPSAPELHS